jgi:hypothetical protein
VNQHALLEDPHDAAQMTALALAVERLLNGDGPDQIGFALLVFRRDGGPASLVSTDMEADDLVTLLRHAVDSLEPPAAAGHA